jgi:hypothetical protein
LKNNILNTPYMNVKKSFFKSLTLCAVIFLGISTTQAQNSQDMPDCDTFKVVQTATGCGFKYRNAVYSYSQMLKIMQSCPEAVSALQISRNQNIVAVLTGVFGGFGVGWAAGWTLGTIISVFR